jgi:putative ABC transport system permease protein
MPEGGGCPHPETSPPPAPAARAAVAQVGPAFLLAWRNLAYDRTRFAVTMVGIVFAVVLTAVQAGLFFGFTATTTAVIRHTRADLWIGLTGLRNFEIAMPQLERHRNIVAGVPGIARAEALLVFFSAWRKPLGGTESVIVVGFDPNSGLAGPWNVVAGDPADLRLPDAVFIDDINKAKLGVERLGQGVEINEHRARVLGFTHGIRSFTTSPYVFATYRNAIEYGYLRDEQANYIIARLAPGADAQTVKQAIRRRMPDVEVMTRDEFADMTTRYWMFSTGAGTGILVAAMLGLIVGMVIVAQVLYATTMDHLTEFGTLRAMGAPQSFILRVILWQATISAILGHTVGILIAMLIAHGSQYSTALIIVAPGLALGLLAVTFLMCITASLVSIRKALTIDPAMVFQR